MPCGLPAGLAIRRVLRQQSEHAGPTTSQAWLSVRSCVALEHAEQEPARSHLRSPFCLCFFFPTPHPWLAALRERGLSSGESARAWRAIECVL